MLFQLVERACRTIDGLSILPDPELAEQILASAPDAVEQCMQSYRASRKEATKEKASRSLAFVAQTAIKSIPRSARAMVAKINNRRVDSAQRCAMASILAY